MCVKHLRHAPSMHCFSIFMPWTFWRKQDLQAQGHFPECYPIFRDQVSRLHLVKTVQCSQTTQLFPGFNMSVGFKPLCKCEFYLQVHNFAWSPPEAEPWAQASSGTSMGICKISEGGPSSAQMGRWKVRDWKMRSFLFYSLGHKELFI